MTTTTTTMVSARKGRGTRQVRVDDLYAGPNPETTDGRTCAKCGGTGTYCWGGTINGKPIRSGSCFGCGGRGRQSDCGADAHAERAQGIARGERDTHACCDRVRNDLYWRFGVKVYF